MSNEELEDIMLNCPHKKPTQIFGCLNDLCESPNTVCPYQGRFNWEGDDIFYCNKRQPFSMDPSVPKYCVIIPMLDGKKTIPTEINNRIQ